VAEEIGEGEEGLMSFGAIKDFVFPSILMLIKRNSISSYKLALLTWQDMELSNLVLHLKDHSTNLIITFPVFLFNHMFLCSMKSQPMMVGRMLLTLLKTKFRVGQQFHCHYPHLLHLNGVHYIFHQKLIMPTLLSHHRILNLIF
jgi:hypothetical protein